MLKRISSFTSALVISLSSLFVFAPALVSAAADTCTWTGGGGDNNFTTAANWSGCDNGTVPESGDALVIDNTGISTDEILVNDLVAATFTSITFQGSVTDYYQTISGNAFTLTSSITVNAKASIEANITLGGNLAISGTTSLLTLGDISGNTLALGSYSLTIDVGDPLVHINSDVTGSGALNFHSAQASIIRGDNSTYTGPVSVDGGTLYVEHQNALGTAAAGTTIVDGATLLFYMLPAATEHNISEPITMAGDGYGWVWTDFALGTRSGSTKFNFTGPVTLTGNTQVSPGSEIKISGSLSGAFTLTVARGELGNLVIAASPNNSTTQNGTYEAPAYTETLSDASPSTPVAIDNNETIIVTGTRGSISVNEGGTLKGTGTVGTVVVNDSATIAPGLSPGCLNSGNLTFVSGSTYEFEVGGATECTEYDQIKVTGTVTLGNGTLNTVLYNDFKPVKDQVYKIIDNDAAEAVSGTFLDLAEGDTFEVDGYVLKISYVGGDGNDVTLTVQSVAVVPTVPDTGFKLMLNNPILTLVSTTLMAGAMLALAKKYKQITNR